LPNGKPFVPNRLVWNNWERFNGEQDNPGDSTDYNIPLMAPFTPDINSVADYFGLPITGKALSGIPIMSLRSKDTLTTSIGFKMESMTKGIIRN
jgi:hypothetical protein